MIDPAIEQAHALRTWRKLQADPNADSMDRFMAFLRTQDAARNVNKAAPRRVENQWTRRMREVLEEELSRFPTDRRLTDWELERVIERVATRSGQELAAEYRRLVRDAYMAAANQARATIGLGPFVEFGLAPRVMRETLAVLTRGDALAETFANFSAETAADFRDVVREAYDAGSVDPGRITLRLIDRVGYRRRGALERIARTETEKVYNQAAADVYRAREEETGEQDLYIFIVTDDDRLCPVCSEIERRVGGGVSLAELREIIISVSTDPVYGGHPNWEPTRDSWWPVPHPNDRCSHPVRKVGD